MRIRPFDERDVPHVASLWQYWFRDKTRTPDADLVDLARRIYVGRPGGDPDVTSLVAEDQDGSMLGFLGVTATPVIVDGERRTLAGVFPSVVAPEASSTVASLLLRKFLAGPQVLTISDGGHVKFERIWQLLGGRIAPTASLRWIKLLRPTRLGGGRVLDARGYGRAVRPLWEPLARGVDAVIRRARPTSFRAPPSPFRGERLTAADLIATIELQHARTRLRPAYDVRYLGWLFREMANVPGQGDWHATRVRAPDGRVAGWWVAYLKPGGASRVFALDADERHIGGVVDQLFEQADAAGVGALVGRLEPKLRKPLSSRGTFVHNGGSLQMIHSSDRSLLDDALLGRLAFSRLEGENWYWWGIATPPDAAA